MHLYSYTSAKLHQLRQQQEISRIADAKEKRITKLIDLSERTINGLCPRLNHAVDNLRHYKNHNSLKVVHAYSELIDTETHKFFALYPLVNVPINARANERLDTLEREVIFLLTNIALTYNQLERQLSHSITNPSAFALREGVQIPNRVYLRSDSNVMSELGHESIGSNHSRHTSGRVVNDEYIVDFNMFRRTLNYHTDIPSTASIRSNPETMALIDQARDNAVVDVLNILFGVTTGMPVGSWMQSLLDKLHGMNYDSLLDEHTTQLHQSLDLIQEQLKEIESIHLKSSDVLSGLPHSLNALNLATLNNEIKISELLFDRMTIEHAVLISIQKAVEDRHENRSAQKIEVIDKINSLEQRFTWMSTKMRSDLQNCSNRISTLSAHNNPISDSTISKLSSTLELLIEKLDDAIERVED